MLATRAETFEEGADAMLQAVCEEIGKGLLTDEEIRTANPDECVCGISDARAMCQAQLGKILASLQPKQEAQEPIRDGSIGPNKGLPADWRNRVLRKGAQ